jgi:hypothetical protein
MLKTHALGIVNGSKRCISALETGLAPAHNEWQLSKFEGATRTAAPDSRHRRQWAPCTQWCLQVRGRIAAIEFRCQVAAGGHRVQPATSRRSGFISKPAAELGSFSKPAIQSAPLMSATWNFGYAGVGAI